MGKRATAAGTGHPAPLPGGVCRGGAAGRVQQVYVLDCVQSVYSRWLMGVGGQVQQQAGDLLMACSSHLAAVWWHAQQLHVWASLANQTGV